MKKILFLLIIFLAISLRIFKLGQNPVSLYWDEASLGYNAYTIATSLRDEHGEFLPLARFIAFGDYKPPGYIYLTVPFILLFGLTEFSVRFPSMLAGLGMVLVTYYLAKELFGRETPALLASLILAVSAWAIQFSRAAFEANLAAFFNLSAIFLFLASGRRKCLFLPGSVLFIFSFYTFNANRIIAPLLLFGLSMIYWRQMLQNKKWVLVSAVVSLILIFPSISYLQSRESKLRFQEVSIFNNPEPVKVSNERIALDGNVLLAKIIHNRRFLFGSDFLKHYFDNFSGRFLFSRGDVNPRLAVQNMGELYAWDLPFLILGIYWFLRRREKNLSVLILWMLVTPIPAATARETPHALRILSILPAYQIIIAYGLYQAMMWVKSNTSKFRANALFFALCFLLSANIFYYLHDYYMHYPGDWSGEWQYGYKQMVSYVSSRENDYDSIYVTNALGRPYIYFAFYQKMPLSDFLNNRTATRDWFGFWDVKSIGKVRFEFDTLKAATGKILTVTTSGNVPGGFQLINSIKNPAGEDVFLIAEKY